MVSDLHCRATVISQLRGTLTISPFGAWDTLPMRGYGWGLYLIALDGVRVHTHHQKSLNTMSICKKKEFSMRYILITASLLLACTLNPVSAVELPSLPEDLSPFMGDPERGAEPRAKHAATRTYPELDPVINVNQGNPFTDYGHFRMFKAVQSRNRSNPLRLDVDIKGSKERWQTQPWQDGDTLYFSLAAPLEDAPQPEHGFPLVVLQPGIGGVDKKNAGDQMWITEAHQRLFPSYVVYLHPQGQRTHSYMTRPDGINNIEPTAMIGHYQECIVGLAQSLPNVDSKRIYLVGHSMGGSSTWQLMLRSPELYAAAVPNAGVPPIDVHEAERLKNIPIWMMMGNDDPWSGSIPYTRTYQNLLQVGAQKVRYWEIQDIGHSSGTTDIWPVAAWLFAQRRE
ncbi:MAG: hypothetical protein EA401_10230 [Planctomycetota bacterium]|nr:MAG: hypothetical protein EA401_10230 [Planctomycetota bacterium]